MKKEIDANELFELIKKFIHISINSIAGSKPGEFSKNYRNTKIKVSFYSMHGGNSKFQNAPTFTFLAYRQKVTHGIYPIIHLNRKDPVDNFTIAYGISEKTQPEILWNNSTLKKLESNGSKSLYYTYVQTVKSEDDINANKDEIIKTINEMIDNYHKTFNGEIQMPEEPATDKPKFPLNQILYGPPGTGKTYNTVLKAMSIINDKNYDDADDATYQNLKTKFDDLKRQHRIEFVTFHQSYSYEEFVEGIKPDLDKDNLIYRKSEGIFKKICKNASKNLYKLKTNETINTISFKDVMDAFKEKYPEGSNLLNLLNISYDDNNFIFHFGRQEQDRKIDLSKIEQLFNQNKHYNTSIEFNKDYEGNTSLKGYYHNFYKELLNIKNTLEDEQQLSVENNNEYIIDENAPKYVLIIDEINRGNISKIFGELITLIESDKRKGAQHELKVSLPYSSDDELFGVPKNLYIIGTMNTSDRSIASIDIALRRRFKFVEMMPKPEKLVDKNNQPLTVDGINLQNILKTLNDRISYLLDRDHQIGHSYFMNWQNDDMTTFKDVWFDSILPLLNEYFYSDWDKLQAILGAAENENTFIIKIPRPELPYSNNCADEECHYDFSKKENTSNEQFKKMLEKANLIAGIKND